jgi:TfoX/Sxy family transcriptional regulator of competence genes
MATSKDYIEFLSDKFAHINGIRFRKMFGEYGYYLDDKVIGFVCDNTAFLKITPKTSALIPHSEKGPCYPGSKDYFILDENVLDDRDLLVKVLKACAEAVITKSKKNKAKSKM